MNENIESANQCHTREKFILGVNYWPKETAMFWWKKFDPTQVKRDFSLLDEYNFKLIRIFLLWEDFQPEMKKISPKALDNLVRVADIAYDSKIKILPTFFCGHMSGLNWLPWWMITSAQGERRFPIFSMNEIRNGEVRNMYTDREVRKAQKFFIHETVNALQGHPAIWGWDLGNETSNVVLPPGEDSARAWLEEMLNELKRYDEELPVTLGLHQEDLENNNILTPVLAAQYCDLLSMHAYPGYANWSNGPLDEKFPIFLLILAKRLGGKEVILGEFGLPIEPASLKLSEEEISRLGNIKLASEAEAEEYYDKLLKALPKYGIRLALVWCFADYEPNLWEKPPFDQRVYERFFGAFHWDGKPKAIAKICQKFSANVESYGEKINSWIDITAEEFYEDAQNHIKRLYKKFQEI